MTERDVYVVGVGHTKFKKHAPEKDVVDLGTEACEKAINDAEIDRQRLDAALGGIVFSGEMQAPSQLVTHRLGILGIPTHNLKNACSTSAHAVHEATQDIANGVYDSCLCFGMEQLSDIKGGVPLGVGYDHEASLGMSMFGKYALRANRHMNDYGTTKEQLAKVALKSRRNAKSNENAMFNEELTLEEVLESKTIAEPLTLYQCCPMPDGAAATILVSEDIADEFENPIKILGTEVVAGSYYPTKPSDKTVAEETGSLLKAANSLYENTGVHPDEIDFAEVHDAFTIGELRAMETLGFCEVGEAGKLVEQGETEIDGDIPINPSGGMLSKGHPLAATGCGMIYETVKQLRGEAAERQVPDCEIGLTETLGGGVAGMDVAMASVSLLSNK